MPPSKASRAAAAAHEDPDSKTTNPKDKNGHNTHHTNGKMRRVASSTGSNLKEVQNAANMPSPAKEAPTSAPTSNPSVRLCPQDSYFPWVGYPPTQQTLLNSILIYRSIGPSMIATSSIDTAANTTSTPPPPTQATTDPGS